MFLVGILPVIIKCPGKQTLKLFSKRTNTLTVVTQIIKINKIT